MDDAQQNSGALMAALQAGDDAALRGLIAAWQRPLLSFVYRYVQNEVDARELVHETFVRLHGQRHRFRGGASFSGWLFAIAANVARNHVRWRHRHPVESGEEEAAGRGLRDLACPGKGPDGRAIEAERVRAVRAALAALPHEEKTALLLFEYEQLSYREIAAAVGCSEKGVEARLTRARARLRTALGDWLEETPRRERRLTCVHGARAAGRTLANTHAIGDRG